MYKGVGFALLILSLFLKYPMEMKLFSLTENKLFHFIDRPHITVCRWTVSILSLNCLKCTSMFPVSHFP